MLTKEGQSFLVKFTEPNTGAATININSIGVISLKKNATENLDAADINTNQLFLLVFDGTNFQVIGLGGGVKTVTGVNVDNTDPKNPIVQQSERRYASSGNYAYCGSAPYNTAVSTTNWTITRLNIAADGTVTIACVSGVNWTDYLTHTYTTC
jgi:hypothetical protein